MSKIRRITSGGETWFSESDLQKALRDMEAIRHAACMLVVSRVDHGEGDLESIQKCIAYFYFQAAGVDGIEPVQTPEEDPLEPDWVRKPGSRTGEPHVLREVPCVGAGA